MKSKVLENKKKKKESLLNSAFELLTQKDITEVSVSDIVSMSNLAKGTFYLYFKDKYHIRDVLIDLENNQSILRFIQRNLSIGVFQTTLKNAITEDTFSIIDDFTKRALEAGYHYDNPHTILYMIIELAGSTCYDAILHNIPLPIEEYKPYLFNAIRAILHSSNTAMKDT